jgi:hypothetical protein
MRECAYRVLNAMVQGEGSHYSASFISVTSRLPSEILNSVVDYLGSKGALIVTRAPDVRARRQGLRFSAIEITPAGRGLCAVMAERRALQPEGLELAPIEITMTEEDYARAE